MQISEVQERIARRVALEFKDGDVVNLGIGLPTLVTNFIPEGISIDIQSENGFVGMGPGAVEGEEDPDLIDAGGRCVTMLPGGAFFDSLISFSMIRGGYIDATVLGALQVDEEGNLANYMIPGKMVPGIGGAMDLVVGARRVIIATEHKSHDGSPKIVKSCTLPLTARGVVDLVVTDIAVIEVTEDGLLLKEVADGLSVDDVVGATEAKLLIKGEVGRFQ